MCPAVINIFKMTHVNKANYDKYSELFIAVAGFFILVSFSGCRGESEYLGYTKTRSGINYKLNVIGEGQNTPQPGDYITIDLFYSTVCDSVFFSGRRKFRLEQPAYRGSAEECFAMLRTGDEADFIINAYEFFNKTVGVAPPGFFVEEDDIKISVIMIDIQTEQSYQQEKQAFLSWIEDIGEYERFRLESFIKSEQIPGEPDQSGLHRVMLNEGTGKRVEAGDTIEIHYEGKFLDGRFFDSTRKTDQVFQFVFGEEMQLLRVVEKAVGSMREGDKALIIIPSDLAFGSYGSSTGVIPPYSSLIYEIEVLTVR